MFEPTLDDAPPQFFEALEENANYVQYRIAYCPESDRDLLLNCVMIAYRDGDGVPIHEFKFEFAVVSNDGAYESFRTMERDRAARFIPASIRSQIMDSVETGLAMLVEAIRPKRLFRVTKSRNTPEKALAKHHRLTRLLHRCGYRIYDAGIDVFGRNYWDMLAD